MAGAGKPPRRPRKAAPPKPTAADRAKAKAQVSNVTPLHRPPEVRAHNARRGKGPTSPKGLAVAQRRQEATQLRRMGLTYAQIADQLRERYPDDALPASYDKTAVYRDIQDLLDTVNVESAQAYLEEDLAILLSLQRRVYPAALNGDLKAVRVMLDILERRSRYLGLDSPVKHAITGADGGPVHLAVEDPGAVYEAALGALDQLLPHVEPPTLPGSTGTE